MLYQHFSPYNSVILIGSDSPPDFVQYLGMQGPIPIGDLGGVPSPQHGGSVAFLPLGLSKEKAREVLHGSQFFALCVDNCTVQFPGTGVYGGCNGTLAVYLLMYVLDLASTGPE
jgi:hypothetical protein